jgi:hypothetical protein
MSIYYLPKKPISFETIINMRDIPRDTMSEEKQGAEDNVCFTDGVNCLWASKSKRGYTTFSTWGLSEGAQLIHLLEIKFAIQFVNDTDCTSSEFNELVEKEYREDYYTIKLP